MKRLLSLSIVVCLAGCVTWYKPDAQQGEFERDKYQCLQESQQRVGAAQVNPYGGSAVNTVQTNNMLFGPKSSL
jgi:starvation-inducible outer membrane lipoprotein